MRCKPLRNRDNKLVGVVIEEEVPLFSCDCAVSARDVLVHLSFGNMLDWSRQRNAT
jgi:hypothetical protein